MIGIAEATSTAGSALVLGRYRPLRPLGLDSPSAVWLARDERTGIDVALKRFERDTRLGLLVGSTDEAEREIEGSPEAGPRALRACAGLRARQREGLSGLRVCPEPKPRRAPDLTLRQIVELLAQVCDGLAHAHSLGIVHRDVKPTNILVEDGPPVAARIVDFEKAQLDGADTIPRTSLAPGAFPYVAPEVIRREKTTGAADVWCVGLMLALAVGFNPFVGTLGRHLVPREDSQASGAIEFTGRERRLIEDRILAGTPPLLRVGSSQTRRLHAAIDAALCLDPKDRPTAEQLADELRALTADVKEN